MFRLAIHQKWPAMGMPAMERKRLRRPMKIYDIGDLHVAPNRMKWASRETFVRMPMPKQPEKEKDIPAVDFPVQKMTGGRAALSQGGTPVFWKAPVKFRTDIRIEVAKTTVDRKVFQVEITVSAAAVTIQTIRIELRDRKREHRSIRQDRARVPAELRVEPFSAQNILDHFPSLLPYPKAPGEGLVDRQ